MQNGDTSNKARRVRLQVQLSDAVVAAIDDYRFATRATSRSEAVRQLLKKGQAARPPSAGKRNIS
jgi:metal-responsive CopG/Arc/MetJ family transcriptional regulator